MKEKTTQKLFKVLPLFYLFLLIFFVIYSLLYWNEIKEHFLLLFFFTFTLFLIFIFPISIYYKYYHVFLFIYRDKIKFKKLTNKEYEIVEDAKKLIKIVDDLNIPSIDMKIYKISSPPFTQESYFFFDEKNNELCLFISFKKHLRYGENVCFVAVVHEMLHAYNLRNSTYIFKPYFLEGLNQLLTSWLIKTYSTKYDVPKTIHLVTFSIGNLNFRFLEAEAYGPEVEKAEQYLSKYNIDIKECYLNYINMNPEFFKENIPEQTIYINNTN